MRFSLAAAAWLASFPLAAEFREIKFTIADTGCASCGESLKKRLARVRGVESAEESGAGKITLKLEEGNRVRIEQLRDFVAQGGNRIEAIAVEAEGVMIEGEGGVRFQPDGLTASYRASGGAKAGARGRARGSMDAKLDNITIESWQQQ